MHLKYLVSYDIASDRKRTKAAKVLEVYGVRIQFSVFECELNKTEVKQLRKKLEEFINLKTDSLMFFPLCENCYNKKITLGVEYNIRRISVLTFD